MKIRLFITQFLRSFFTTLFVLVRAGIRRIFWLISLLFRGVIRVLSVLVKIIKTSGAQIKKASKAFLHGLVSIVTIVLVKTGLTDKLKSFWKRYGVPLEQKCRVLFDRILKLPAVQALVQKLHPVYVLATELLAVAATILHTGQPGELSPYILGKLAIRNLLNSLSRTAITVGAMASGTAAIVFLVGFAYGLQSIVTNRLIQPNSLRLADIQTSSTALELNKETITTISNLAGVEDISPVMSTAGSLNVNGSRTEVVVVGARNTFFDYSHIDIIAGERFSDEAEAPYLGATTSIEELLTLQDGEVAGAMSQTVKDIENGQEITGEQVLFRVTNSEYIPVRTGPHINSEIVGYVRGSVIDSYSGTEVWGGTYESVSTVGRAHQTSVGEWKGRWVKAVSLQLYQEVAPTVYTPKVNEHGQQVVSDGYLTQLDMAILSSEDRRSQQMIDVMLTDYLEKEAAKEAQTEQGSVLGESTESASGSADVANQSQLVAFVASESARVGNDDLDDTTVLQFMFQQEQEEANKAATQSATSAILSLPRLQGNEMIISTALLALWEVSAEDALGMKVNLEYIISGGLVRGVSGRVVTEPVEYTIVGVFKNDEQSLVYTPLSDIESMGVTKYTLAKVLSTSPDELSEVRERIESLGFITRSIADTLGQVERLFGVMRFLLGSFGMIAFIVALFGMFNTLTVSLLERTREIGVMKTLGTTDRDIMKLMVAESSMIGMFGGFFGILLGVVLGLFTNWATMLVRDDTSASLFEFPLQFLIMVFILSVCVGIVTGLYPARRAQGISALNALRYE